jgi:hypothetical protein
MNKHLFAAGLCAIVLAAPAAGQIDRTRYNSNGLPSSAGDAYMRETLTVGARPILPRERAGDRRECLRHKATGRKVCKTRSEWEELASGKRDPSD